MSRIAGGDVITVKPTNNVYTALAAAAVVAQIVALIFLFMRASAVFGKGLL
ncbi:MAG TPA: hypothetical protein VK324_18170 [Tepidisphaeraceae bacterium]|nr:hypothetical protein [Tepidisphaeraceae bacterium]